MRRISATALFAAAVLAGGVAMAQGMGGSPAPYRPGPHNITLPSDWETRFIRFATVDKAERKIIRHLYVNPEAFAAARPGQPLPDGTLIIMADTRARLGADGTPLRDHSGRLIPEPGWIALGVQEKRPGWGEGYPPEKRNGTWEYARFLGDGRRNDASVEACFTCHIQTRAGQDFAFDFWDYVQKRQ
ncbi:MAG: cytochrome P460 family protein [Acetobacteraceae bacterium]|nr:cytochrome P460 family protein [Acetobacteraceae bacterium]